MYRLLDPASSLVILTTLVLFVVALFVKGFGQTLLLEAGVFLVSLKLIIMAHKLSSADQRLADSIRELQKGVDQLTDLVTRSVGRPGNKGPE
jgi:hypothetical protein